MTVGSKRVVIVVAGQLAFGADIILARGRLLALAILAPTLWLWAADAVSMGRGIWMVDPGQSIGLAWGPLPLEEMVFFLMTNIMIATGMVLLLSQESARRVSGQSLARRI